MHKYMDSSIPCIFRFDLRFNSLTNELLIKLIYLFDVQIRAVCFTYLLARGVLTYYSGSIVLEEVEGWKMAGNAIPSSSQKGIHFFLFFAECRPVL